jgi:3',5'-cyclic AMP phosphodiesterase CpdA
MSPSRVVVVSDSHLTARVANTDRNWEAALRHIDAAAPDLVIHVGDLSMNGTHDPQDLRHGLAQMKRVPAPWRVVPGNHDIGDTNSALIDPDDVVTADRVARWNDLFGPDRWAVDLDRWRLVGVNAQLFGTGLPGEAEQWDFVDDALNGTHPTDQRLLFVTHKPIAAPEPELAGGPPYRFVPSPARDRLWERVRAAGVEVVLSGHVHQSRALQLHGVSHLWAPTTWAVLPETMQQTIGTKRCGLMELELPDEGSLAHRFVEPEGLAQHVINENGSYPPSH